MSACWNWRWTFALAGVCGVLGSVRASAQDIELEPEVPHFVSPERFVLEIRIGPYRPDMGANPAFTTYFQSDKGPLIGAELDVIGYRMHDLLYVAAGGRFGTASFTGKTLSDANEQTPQGTTLSLLPLDLLAVVRVDALARKLSVPFIFTAKLGYEWSHWTASTEGSDQHTGWSVGLVYGAQVALDLDVLDRAAARNMDEEWGINHSFLFFELFKFAPTGGSLPVGDATWTAGLGFVF